MATDVKTEFMGSCNLSCSLEITFYNELPWFKNYERTRILTVFYIRKQYLIDNLHFRKYCSMSTI